MVKVTCQDLGVDIYINPNYIVTATPAEYNTMEDRKAAHERVSRKIKEQQAQDRAHIGTNVEVPSFDFIHLDYQDEMEKILRAQLLNGWGLLMSNGSKYIISEDDLNKLLDRK